MKIRRGRSGWVAGGVGLVVAVTVGGAGGQTSDRIPADGGAIVVTPIVHASVQIEHAGRVIQVDPWTAGDLTAASRADLILITDDPPHHLDPEAIARLRKPGTPVVMPEIARARYPEGTVLANGEHGRFAGIDVEAVPAYDLTPGQPFHPKGEANGYVVTLGGRRLFVSGVGECVPEIQALRDIDVAFLPMNLPVDRMRPRPVAECARTFQPAVLYVNHYDQGHAAWLADPSQPRPSSARQDTAATLRALQEALRGEPIELRDARWYPPLPD